METEKKEIDIFQQRRTNGVYSTETHRLAELPFMGVNFYWGSIQ